MAMINPKGRVNYEPNSWSGDGAGPRESPEKGFQSYPAPEEGEKLRVRSETFADHFSQARQFYTSQTEIEQNHIIDAFTFELSKVEKLAIRERMVAQLMNVDAGLAENIAKGLGLKKMPEAAQAAKPTRQDLEKSPALSIILNGPKRFQGRKLGVLARPQFFLSRYPAEAARKSQLHTYTDQCAEMSVRPFSAGRPHGDDQSQRAG